MFKEGQIVQLKPEEQERLEKDPSLNYEAWDAVANHVSYKVVQCTPIWIKIAVEKKVVNFFFHPDSFEEVE